MKPAGWAHALVSDVAGDGPRSIAIGPFGSSLKSELYSSRGVPLIRGQNIADGRQIDDSDLVFVPDSVAATFPACIVRKGDLVFPHRGAIGRVAIIGEREYLLSSSMMKLTCNPHVVDSTYMFYYFRGPGRRELLARASTVGTPGIGQPLKSLRGIEVVFPSLGEQKAIGDLLGTLDDKIAANAKLAITVDDLLASKFARLTSASTSAPLGTIARVNVASTKPNIGGSLRYLDIAAVGVGGYEMPEVISWDDAPGRARRVITRGDTVWSTVRPNRRSHALVLDDDPLLIGSTGLAVLTSRNNQFAFLYEATRAEGFTSYLESAAEGSAYPAVRADRFLDAPVPEITPAEREAFEREAAPLRRRSHSASVESRRLAATRDALLPLLMSGTIRGKDAESVVEGVV